MCGIVGVVAIKSSVNPDLLERATATLAHRGPDDSGTVIIRDTQPLGLEIGLGNRRLAILDLSPLGHQPMQDSETGNWIVYNGEIYNFRDIRKDLEQAGVRFRGHSDTEVLLRAYGRWGEECLAKVRGMFAFAIWDAGRRRLFLARDPMGIKPLYFFVSERYFLFASEVRTLLNTGLVPRRIDYSGLLNYFAFGSACDPITLVEGVSALPAGHFLVWENGVVCQKMYWDLTGAKSPSCAGVFVDDVSRRNIEEELHETLVQSIQMQMVSDVPVGVFLSGGIDSSAITGILTRGGAHLNTFSVIFREPGYSEAKYSRLVAKSFHTEHHELMVSQKDALALIPLAIEAMDQPTIDGVNTYIISYLTRAAGIKVVLSGLGGDELFAGYSSFRTVPLLVRFLQAWRHLPTSVRRPLSNLLARLSPISDQGRKLIALTGSDGELLNPYFFSRTLFTPESNNAFFPSIDPRVLSRSRVSLDECAERAEPLDAINRVSYMEARSYMVNTLLRDADVMSMAHGLEMRVPLIDHVLADKLMRIPGAWKINRRTPKPLLVSSLGDSLPEKVVYRKKRGFTLPFELWLREELHEQIDLTLANTASGSLCKILNAAAVQGVWKDFQQGRTSWSRPWSLYVVQRWCELHGLTA